MSKGNKKLSLEPYKGTRDFYPKDQFVQNYIFEVWRRVAQRYGYLEYGASIIEESDLYRAKTGEEIVDEQTYSFTDRGGRDVTIRPEMTPTVARMVAQKRKELAFPLRWFSIPNLFRYERPQRGRLREHWQLNCDIFGVDEIEADVEIISLAYDIMKEFGAKDENFEIRINSRKVIKAFSGFYNCTDEQEYKITRLLDKHGKISDEEFQNKMAEILGSFDRAVEYKNELYKMDKIKDVNDFKKLMIAKLELKEVASLITKLNNDRGIKNVAFYSTLARGLDYYTGTVFEMYDTSPRNPRALFGGGRYDDLVSIFGVEKVSGVGFGWGDVTTQDFLETYNLLPEYKSPVQLYVCHLEGYVDAANRLASKLRKQGVNAAVDLTGRKVAAQIKTADKELIPYIVVVGEKEAESGRYKVKNLKDGKETEAEIDDIARLASYVA